MEKQEYDFIYYNPINGINYYRLKQVDFDGGFEYSKTISVEIKKDDYFNIYPNPVDGEINIEFNESLNNPSIIKIMNAQGLLVFYENINMDEGVFKMNSSGYAAGIYFLETTNGRKLWQERFVKR